MSFSYQVQHASLEWDAQGLPFAADYQDVYYSRHDPLGESTHVFLHGNRLPERFAALRDAHFIVAELGFGAGLNFLNTCRLWCNSAPESATLHYVACELHPFRREDLERLHAGFAELAVQARDLQDQLPEPCTGVHQLQFHFGAHRVVLSLLYGPATQLPHYLGAVPGLQVDAWFLDGFSPATNPGMWEAGLFRRLAPFCHADSTLSSYSVAGNVRRALAEAGFACEKLPGFAGKRHMLRAGLPGAATRTALPQGAERSACVVGAGLAGCSTARLLAERGWQVVVLEAADVAAGASGNPQGVLHFKPATVDSPDNRFNLHAYLYAAREYARLELPPTVWSPCGMVQLAHDHKLRKRFAKLASGQLYPPGVFEVLDAGSASQVAGLPLAQSSLYFPQSGWLSPAALCAWYLDHSAITLRRNTRLTALLQDGDGWWLQLATARGKEQLRTTQVVLSTAEAIHELEQTRHIPVICNRGQVDAYEASAGAGAEARPVVCSTGYCMPPAPGGLQCVGGSFSLAGDGPQARAADSALHRLQLAATSPALARAFAKREPVLQRRATRCTLADRMPVVGRVGSDRQEYPALWVNAAHGSQGLARTPIAAAWLAALIDRTPAPLEADTAQLLAPGRFPGTAEQA